LKVVAGNAGCEAEGWTLLICALLIYCCPGKLVALGEGEPAGEAVTAGDEVAEVGVEVPPAVGVFPDCPIARK